MLFEQEALGAGYLAKVGPLQIKTTNLQCKIKHNSSFECTRSDHFTNTEVGQMVAFRAKAAKAAKAATNTKKLVKRPIRVQSQ
jgi:NDP-sugar pyrophosphorylase family protein